MTKGHRSMTLYEAQIETVERALSDYGLEAGDLTLDTFDPKWLLAFWRLCEKHWRDVLYEASLDVCKGDEWTWVGGPKGGSC